MKKIFNTILIKLIFDKVMSKETNATTKGNNKQGNKKEKNGNKEKYNKEDYNLNEIINNKDICTNTL